MKKMFFYSLLILFSSSCEKWETNPEKVELGTFRWKVDGEKAEASSTLFGLVKPISVSYRRAGTQDYFNYPPGFLSIQGIATGVGTVGMQKIGVFNIGEYQLTHQDCGNYDCDAGGFNPWGEMNSQGGSNYYTLEKGKLTITKLDTIAKIISGNFYFDAVDELGKRKKITHGVFNVNYNTN